MKTKTGYIQFIETLRAFAALAVLLFHFISYYNGEAFLIENEEIRSVSSFGAQGVELFYIISGFVIVYSLSRNNYRLSNYGKYLLKRILRIIPVYWLTIIAIQGILFLIGIIVWKTTILPDVGQLLVNAFFIVDLVDAEWINPVFATLAVEMQFYVLIGLIFPLLSKKNTIKYSVFLIWLLLGYFTRDYYTVFMNAPFFISGILFYEMYKNKEALLPKIFVLGIAVLLSIVYPWDDLFILAIAVFCFFWARPSFGWSNWLGNFSYSIYLTHGMTGGWVLYFLSTGSLSINPWIMILLAIVVSIIGAYIFYRIIEVPAIRWSRKISWKTKQQQA